MILEAYAPQIPVFTLPMKKSHLLLVAFAGLFASCATPPGNVPSSSGRDALGHRPGPKGFRTVVIDAGHGGEDSGARSPSTGDFEKNLTLDVARRVQRHLAGQFRTVMMRDGDAFVDLDDRVAKASQYGDAVLVSIHFNSGPSHLRGPETYYWRVDSYSLARRVQRKLESLAGTSERGLVRRRLRLTRNPEIPSILAECGYISNADEARFASDSSYRGRIAGAIASAIREQAALGDEGAGPLPPPLNAPLSRATDAPE